MFSKTHIIIPDAHAHPDYNNKRFDLLAKLILDIRPDIVVDIGDFFDMASLCTYDKGKKGFERRRYIDDINVGLDAQDRIISPLRHLKRKQPKFIRCLGNHENRINRVLETETILEGTISTNDLQSKEYNWEETPFLKPVCVDGINYSHYFVSGVMGRPISSARQLLIKQRVSCTMGHNHGFDYEQASNIENRRTHALMCGVFVDYKPDYSFATNHLWRSGCVIKHNVSDGDYDLEWVSMERLYKEYDVW